MHILSDFLKVESVIFISPDTFCISATILAIYFNLSGLLNAKLPHVKLLGSESEAPDSQDPPRTTARRQSLNP